MGRISSIFRYSFEPANELLTEQCCQLDCAVIAAACPSLSNQIKVGRGSVRDARIDSQRYTFAAWMVGRGVNIYEVQKLMGDSSVAVIPIYAHVAPSELHKAVDKISISLN